LKSRILKTLLGISLLAFLGGCNPYASEFKCGKDTPFGSCGSTSEIYSEIVNDPKAAGSLSPGEIMLDKCPDCVKGKKMANGRQSAESAYQEAVRAKEAKLLKQPSTPVVVPPLVMRILFFPMQGESGDVLDMAQYRFVILGKPKFVIGSQLIRPGE
jgi:conjugal transfer pilus assembly protein TraV